MEKVIYLLWRPDDGDVDRWGAELRRTASAVAASPGVRTVQVNVDDSAVADAAVRMTTFDRPVAAVVSIWLDTATGSVRDQVERELSAVSQRMVGYLVTESVPLLAPETEVGSRTDGFANVALLRRPDELDQVTWLQRWQGLHTAVAVTTQSTFGYVQNVVVRPITTDAPTIDGIVEELFPIEALGDFHVFFDTGGDDAELAKRMSAMTSSVANFSGEEALLDVVPTSRYLLYAPPRSSATGSGFGV